MPTLQIIIASTRPGRIGLPIGQWMHQRAAEHDGFDAELIDLAEVNLPFLDEPHHPRAQKYTQQHTLDWSATINRGDAFVFVTPEYNFGFPATLKNAIDFLWNEWAGKPAGILSYGGMSGGVRSAQMLRPVLGSVHLAAVPEAITIPMAGSLITDGVFHPTDPVTASATAMLDSLTRWHPAMSGMRQPA